MYQGDPYDDDGLTDREPQPDPFYPHHAAPDAVTACVRQLADHVRVHCGDGFLDKWGVETNGGVKWLRYTEGMGVGCAHVDLNRGQVAGVLVMVQPAAEGGRTLLGIRTYEANVVTAGLKKGEVLLWRNFDETADGSIAAAGPSCLRDHTGEWVVEGEKLVLSIGLYRMDRCNFFDVKSEAKEHNMDMLRAIVDEHLDTGSGAGDGAAFAGCARADPARPCCECAGCLRALGSPAFAWATEELTNDLGEEVTKRCFLSKEQYEEGTNRQRHSLRSFLKLGH